MSESQCALEKIIMLIITLTGKKKEQKKKTKIYCWQKKKITKIVIYHIVAITATKQINILLSCLKIYARWNFFHVLQDSFKVPHLMEQGYKVNTPANYIHAYNESWFFIIRLLNVISITKIDRILNRSQQATRKIIGGNCKSTKRLS